MEFLLFFTMPNFIETVTPIRTCVAVHLMVAFAVNTFERMRTKLTFLCSKPWWINVSVFFTVLCSLPMMLSLVRSIAFDASGHMWLTPKGWMSPSPTVFTLWNTGICTSVMYSDNESSYVKMTIMLWQPLDTKSNNHTKQ